jgi:hypothetical protein
VPRYYFHLYNDLISLDEQGLELSDLGSAQERAVEEARTMACDSVRNGHLNLDHWIEVSDERGETVHRLTFRDAFTIAG